MADISQDNPLSSYSATSALLALPDELLLHILHFLDPLDLAQAAKTCHRLATTTYDDIIWNPLLSEAAGQPVSESRPMRSFRELYVSLFPYWFLATYQVWFGDSEPSGKLIVTRYDQKSASIVAHQVTAVVSRSSDQVSFWEKDRNVIIHSFNPVVSFDEKQPVLRIDAVHASTEQSNDDELIGSKRIDYGKELPMETFAESGLHSSLMLCRALPVEAISNVTAVWPPLRIPAITRTRNASKDSFQSAGHLPQRWSDVSQNNFRLKKWVEYRGRNASSSSSNSFSAASRIAAALGIGLPYIIHNLDPGNLDFGPVPHDITTYSSLIPTCYLPTPEKPWQGIFVGDYSTHGCEFLLVTQPDGDKARPLPAGMNRLQEWFRGIHLDTEDELSEPDQDDDDLAVYGLGQIPLDGGLGNEGAHLAAISQDCEDAPSGRLEGIKLTGDPNVPRSQYSFIAPDIGHGGFIRVADEEQFRGARVVRAAGHVAVRGFTDDRYIPSQLIMVSHDCLAQFWAAFGHISYYKRIDLAALLNHDGTNAG